MAGHCAVLVVSFVFLHPFLVPFAEIQGTNVTLYGSCNFGQPTFPHKNEMTVYTVIPNSNTLLKHLLCNVWYKSAEGVLRLWLKKTSYTEQTSVISTVIDEQGSLVLPGYIKEAVEEVVYPFHVCPPGEGSSNRNYSIYLSARPNTGINLTVMVDESILREEQAKSVEFGHKVSSRLLVFDVSNIRGIYDHFLVTVRSNDKLQECTLIVSKDCADVLNIDSEAFSFKGSSSAMYLSFTTFGRITLSHASSPQLSTGRWFVGVFLKQSSRDLRVQKIVEVSVGFAGGINRVSFTAPIVSLIMISVLGGLAIAIFADCFLNAEFEHRLVHNFRTYVNSYVFTVAGNGNRVDAGGVNHELTEVDAPVETGGENLSPSPSIQICRDHNGPSTTSTVTYDIARLNVPRHWPGFRNWGDVIFRWFYDDDKTFAYSTAIVAFSVLTGAAQFIISNWRDMIESGNRDTCYYNEGCYRTTSKVDMPYNLIISNLCYVIHGLILALSVSLREATRRVNEASTRTTTRKSFSIAYAFAWALLFQGIFSALYHLCPSRMTFQFDSAFMFITCALVVVALFNSFAEKTQRRQRLSEHSECSETPIRDTKLFLFFVMPLLQLNYLGSIRDTEGFLLFPDAVFYFLAILWIVIMFLWAFYRLMLPWKPITPGPRFLCKATWLCVVFPFFLLIIGLYTVDVKKDWSHFFLFTCLACVMCAVMGFVLSRCSQNIYNRAKRRQDLTRGEKRMLQWKMYFKWPLVNLHVVVYTVGIAVCWAFALHYFNQEPVTDKVLRASKSRELNQECVLWEFFDYHDMWHILSSFGLLLTAYLLIWSIG